jgi:large subunit ribosomal protein L23
MTPESVIMRPLVLTEKGNKLRETDNKYLFEVAREATKGDVKNAVEVLFSVTVTDVHTMVVRGRMRRMGRGSAKTQNWKKAIVALKDGDKIELFEGA